MDRLAVEAWLKKYGFENYAVNEDLSVVVNVDDDVSLSYEFAGYIPVIFGVVSGDFSCVGNKLTSLKGCPESVGGNFFCGDNKLLNLKGCPESVGGSFVCSNNKLTSLEGCW